MTIALKVESAFVDLQEIVESIRANRVRITEHADEEAAAEAINFDEIYLSVMRGEIIEDYPIDRPFPSCLIYGATADGHPIHSVWAFNEATRWAVLITVYRPDPQRWVAWKERRKKDDAI